MSEDSAMVRLVFLPVNQQYAFVFGDAVLRLTRKNGNHLPMFFADRYLAVEAADSCGLDCYADGTVRAAYTTDGSEFKGRK